MSNIAPFKSQTAVAPALPAVSAMKMVAVVAAELPPTLREGQTIKSWLEETHSFVGTHPEVVLANALEAIRSTFTFSPKKAELIDAILKAYQRLGVVLSEDAKRHLSYRQKMPERYTLNGNGEKRYAEDTKVTLVGYFTVQGPQANLIIDRTPGAIVEDFEKSIAPVTAAFAGKEKIAGGDVLERFKTEVKIQCAYRLHGTPADNCGGPVAMLPAGNKIVPLSSIWVALSEDFVNRMRDAYPYARVRNNPTNWVEGMKDAFWRAVSGLDETLYGQGLQAVAELKIEAAMIELNREGKVEIRRSLSIDHRECVNNRTAIELARKRLEAGETVIDRITINGETVRLETIEGCDVAARKLETFTSKIDAAMAAMSAKFECARLERKLNSNDMG